MLFVLPSKFSLGKKLRNGEGVLEALRGSLGGPGLVREGWPNVSMSTRRCPLIRGVL